MAARQSEMPAGMLVPQLGAWLGDWDQEWDGTLALGIHLLIQDFWWERGKKGLTKFSSEEQSWILSLLSSMCAAWFLKFATHQSPHAMVKGWQVGNRWLLFLQPFMLTSQRKGCSFFSCISCDVLSSKMETYDSNYTSFLPANPSSPKA